MDKSEKFWDGMSKKFDKRVQRFEPVYRKTIENAKKYLNQNSIVLDYACGTGIITNELAGSVKTIHAIDISSKMIEAAKRKAEDRAISNIEYERATIFDEKLRNELFDAVLVFNVLHLLEDAEAVVQRVYNLLKPGGMIISATACLGEKKTLLSCFLSVISRLGIVPPVQFFTIADLEKLIAQRNFGIIETEVLRDSYFIAARKQ